MAARGEMRPLLAEAPAQFRVVPNSTPDPNLSARHKALGFLIETLDQQGAGDAQSCAEAAWRAVAIVEDRRSGGALAAENAVELHRAVAQRCGACRVSCSRPVG